MNIEQDGHLGLGIIDLNEEFRDEVPDPILFRHFGPDANIAAAYALAVGNVVRFAMPGRLQEVQGLPYHRITATEHEKVLSDKEEADIVLMHMGWKSAVAYIVKCAEILFDTEVVDYELSIDPECGNVRSTLVFRPHISGSKWPHEQIHERTHMLHSFIEKANHELYMMAVVNVFFDIEDDETGAR